MGASWTDLPVEVQLHVFAEAEPADLGRLASVSKDFNGLIKGNALLYKKVYLDRWDDPAKHPTNKELDWEASVQQAVLAQKIADCTDADKQQTLLPSLAIAITSLSATAITSNSKSPQRNVTYLRSLIENSKDPLARTHLLCQSALFARARNQPVLRGISSSARKQQLASAKMHCLYGAPILNDENNMHMWPYAASKVYDLRNYTDKNRWGPFLDDGSDNVDWEKLEAIMLVLGYNIARIDADVESSLARLWGHPFAGTAAGSYRPVGGPLDGVDGVHHRGDVDPFESIYAHVVRDQAPWCRVKPDPELEKQDPYGVSGTWLRIVCFLDYRDLYDYNFGQHSQPRLRHDPRPPLHTDEAVRLLVMTLVVTGIHYPDQDSDSPSTSDSNLPSPDDSIQADVPPGPSSSTTQPKSTIPAPTFPHHRTAPIVSFTGTARALHAAWDPNANSTLRGTVSTTPEGEIRWTSVSVYNGVEERWKGEGIQVGGIGSARGVLGSWFDKDYAPHGPAGPTAFWKVRDEVAAGSEEERVAKEEEARRQRRRMGFGFGFGDGNGNGNGHGHGGMEHGHGHGFGNGGDDDNDDNDGGDGGDGDGNEDEFMTDGLDTVVTHE